MKFNKSKSWFLKKVKDEEGYDIAAGELAQNPLTLVNPPIEPNNNIWDESQELHNAFGKLIKLKRLDEKLSADLLAKKADIEVNEVRNIENDINYSPKPRTIINIAKALNLPEQPLISLSGAMEKCGPKLKEEAVRFAAKSENICELSQKERQLLNEFIKTLSQGFE